MQTIYQMAYEGGIRDAERLGKLNLIGCEGEVRPDEATRVESVAGREIGLKLF